MATFAHAVGARNREEAQRIYNLMSVEQRAVADSIESLNPGFLKIWERKRP